MRARTVHEVIAAEAVSGTPAERYADMKAIASVIANRARILGVSPEQVVSLTSEFNAYNKPMPAGTQSLVDMAAAAMNDVEVNGPVNNATFYATPAATNNLPNGLQAEAQTTGHVYYSDPQNRAIYTADGLKSPQSPESQISGDPLQAALSQPYTANGLTNGVTALTSGLVAPEAVTSQAVAPTGVDPAFGANGFLQGTPQTFGGLLSTPAQNNFGDMATAGPISAPMDVTATGQMKASTQTPGFANVGLLGVAPSAENWGGLGLEASAAAQPASFDASRFGDVPSTANFDAARFGDPAPTTFDADRFGVPNAVQQAMATPTAINPSQPAMNSFADLAAAGPISAPADTGITSAAFQGLADKAKQNLASMQAQQQTQVAATPAGLLGAAPDLGATASVPSGLLSGYAEQPSVPAGIAAINSIAAPSSSLLSGTSIANMQPTFTAPTTTGLLSQPTETGLATQYQGFTPPDIAQPEASTVNIAQDPAIAGPTSLPALDTVSVPDQPTIAGPATTEATTQQTQANTASAPASATGVTGSGTGTRGLLGGLVNKGTLTGGLLGGVLGGPLGALAGGLLGSKINSAGGLSSMFGGQPMNINNIGTGLANTSSVYGSDTPGLQATANDGQHVTSLGNGWTAVTGVNGVTTTFGPNNLHASYFGPSLTGGRTPGTPGGGGSGGYT